MKKVLFTLMFITFLTANGQEIYNNDLQVKKAEQDIIYTTSYPFEVDDISRIQLMHRRMKMLDENSSDKGGITYNGENLEKIKKNSVKIENLKF